MNKKQLKSGILAVLVLFSALALVSSPAAANYEDGDEAIAVEVDWDDGLVADGDAATIEVENIDTANVDTEDLTVRDATDSSTTYWIEYSDLGNVDPTEGDEIVVSSDDGNALDVSGYSVDYVGAAEIDIADGEGIETNLSVDESYPDLPADVTVAVIDGTDELNSSSVSSDGSDTEYIDFETVDLGDSDNTTVTVQIDDVVNDIDDTAFDSVEEFNSTIIDDGGGGGGGDSDGDGLDNQTLAIIGVVAVVGLLIARD